MHGAYMGAITARISRSRSKKIGSNQGPVVRGVAKEMPVTPAEVTLDFYNILGCPLGKALYPHCLVPQKGFKTIGLGEGSSLSD